MRTLADIEDESYAINKRMMEIFEELRAYPEKAPDLAEELGMLIHKAKVLHCSLRYYQETAAELMSGPCHGPH